MKALILRADAKASVETAQALIDKGFQILSVDTQAVAHALIRVDTIDLLVMDERIEGQLTHAIALSGERRNPYLSAILLTDRTADETDDLYDLIPSLYGMVGSDTAPQLLGKLALSAVSNVETAVARVAQNASADQADETPQLDPMVLARAGMMPPRDDSESGAPCYADVAIAAPAMAEVAATDPAFTFHRMEDVVAEQSQEVDKRAVLEDVEDAISAEVAALFHKHPLLHRVQSPQSFAAKAG
ncbi:imidazoleglycerol-phosphate dehydratase [Yoonia maricola]|nr:imidazoleglycerol-phosphate dehydratase [Yoonia maricola]